MLEADGLVGFLILGLWIYCVIDVIMTDDSLVRNLPKMAWIFLVIILFDVGAIVWLVAGRPKYAGWAPGSTSYRAEPTTFQPPKYRRRPLGPEDDTGFGSSSSAPGATPSHADFEVDSSNTSNWSQLARERDEAARLKVWENQLKRREEELQRRERGWS